MTSKSKLDVHDIAFFAILLAVAIVLGAVESFIPSLLPGFRIGLSNIVILLSLRRLKFHGSFLLALLKPFIVSLIVGTFLQMGFWMSFAGSLGSFFVMYLLSRLSKLSFLSVSLYGSVVHSLLQVAIAAIYALNASVFAYFPLLGLWSLLSGLLIFLLYKMLDGTISRVWR